MTNLTSRWLLALALGAGVPAQSSDAAAGPGRLSVPAAPALSDDLAIEHFSWTRDGRGLVVVTPAAVWVWDDLAQPPRRVDDDWSYSHGFQLSRDGGRLAAVRDRSIVQVWDLKAGQELTPLDKVVRKAKAVALDARGDMLAMVEDDGVHFWDLSPVKERPELTLKLAKASDAAIFTEVRRVLALDAYGRLSLRALQDMKPLAQWKPAGSSMPRLLADPEGRYLAVGAVPQGGRFGPPDHAIDVYGLADGKPLWGRHFSDDMAALAVAPGGRSLLAAGRPKSGGGQEGLYRLSQDAPAPKLACLADMGYSQDQARIIFAPQGVRPGWRLLLGLERKGYDDAVRLLLLDSALCRTLAWLEVSKKGWSLTSASGEWDGSEEAAGPRVGRRVPGLWARLLSEPLSHD